METHETTYNNDEWFATWFDSPYYPMLYRHRNEDEALLALTNLHHFLKLSEGATVLDLGCGQGRHSRTLHNLGYSVVGIDLSPASIAFARELATPGQRFEVQDMRSFEDPVRFNAVFNLFTSFGYFNSNAENRNVLLRIAAHLKDNGFLVLDYLNAHPLLDHQEQKQTIQVDNVQFRTTKTRQENAIVKQIEVHDNGEVYHFRESVQLLTHDDLALLLSQTGFKVVDIFGNYDLHPYQPELSDRCLIIARKS
jgi:SAM-dependent methyltransferase